MITYMSEGVSEVGNRGVVEVEQGAREFIKGVRG